MSNRPYRLLYDYIIYDGTRLYEVEYTDVPDTSPLSEKYQWFLNTNPLSFLKQEGSKRFFRGGIIVDTSAETPLLSYRLSQLE